MTETTETRFWDKSGMTETVGTTGKTEQDVSISPSPPKAPKDPLDMTEAAGMTETNLPITILLSPISYLLSALSPSILPSY